jgi:hypothetical protein
MMRISHAFILILFAAFTLGGCESSKQAQEEKKAPGQVSKEVVKVKAEEPPPPDALAKVGDRYVRLADYEKQLTKLSPKLAESEHGRKYVVNQTVENILIEKEAEARGLTKDPAVVAKIEDFARNLYRNSLLLSLPRARGRVHPAGPGTRESDSTRSGQRKGNQCDLQRTEGRAKFCGPG